MNLIAEIIPGYMLEGSILGNMVGGIGSQIYRYVGLKLLQNRW